MGGATPSGTVPRVKALNCPKCGAAITLRAFEHSVTVVCESCHCILDAQDPHLKILQAFGVKTRVRPLIPLGTRGKLRGTVYEVIGFQVRSTVVEGIEYSWSEYLLFNPYEGFRYLTEYNGHWNDVKTVKSVPEIVPGISKPRARLLGETYVHFQTAQAKTRYVLGEFPWQVRVGEAAEVQDYVAPPRILSAEITEGETVWSLGEYMTGAQVWQNFQLPGQPPGASGVFANQPSPYKGRSLWPQFLIFLAALVGLTVVIYGLAQEHEVFRQTYQFSPRAGERSLVTDVFELQGRTSNVELSIRTNLANNWAYFNLALINEGTGEAYDFGREVSYYYGRDSDGAWSEGAENDQVRIPTVPAGRYYLRVEPEMNSGSVSYELRLRRDVPSPGFFWLAALFLLIPPLAAGVRSWTFEQRRWQESDYATSSGGSGDDDDS